MGAWFDAVKAAGLPLLFAGLGSAVDEVTLAVLLITGPFATLQLIFATIVTVACAPFTREPKLAVTLAPPVQVPALGTQETNVTLSGRLSVTTTLLALFGPLFATVTR